MITKIIIVEGIDGCGKSTLINLLKEKLLDDGFTVGVCNSPICDEYTEPIRSILSGKNMFDEYPVYKNESILNIGDKTPTMAFHTNDNSFQSDKELKEIMTEMFISDKIKALTPGGPIYSYVENRYDYIILDRFYLSLEAYNKKYIPESMNKYLDIIKRLLSHLKCDVYTIILDLSSRQAYERILSRTLKCEKDSEIYDTYTSLKEIEIYFSNFYINHMMNNQINTSIYNDIDLTVTKENPFSIFHNFFNLYINADLPKHELLELSLEGLEKCYDYKEPNITDPKVVLL
jgi:thymidylate kinase